MSRKPLRVATDADAPKRPQTLVEAAQSGDYLELLKAQRLDIARSLQNPDTQGPARAALHRQLGLVARELREIEDSAAEEEAERGATPDAQFDSTAI